MTTPPSSLQDALSDRYRLERSLGAGGMATVYLAEDVRHRRKVAIKVLHPELAAVLGGERFLKEVELTANLQHPHILPLFDSGEAVGQLYYVMPYVDGETLRSRLDREKQLPIPEALQLTREVADALQYAHERGVIHRDIKPENILLQGGHALVADFGIALAVQQAGGTRITQTGLSLGTPQYMSPEQAMGEKTIDARSDVYALGAVLYEMLAGDPPFVGSSAQAIVARVLTERPTPLHTLRDTVPPRVDAAVAQALAKLPADRPATVAAFAAQLTGSAEPPAPRAAAPARWPILPAVLGALALGAALGAGAMLLTRRSANESMRTSYATGNAQLTFDGHAGMPAISPGGDVIAFIRSQCEQPGESGFPVLNELADRTSPCRFALVAMDSAGSRQVTVIDDMRDVRGVRFTSDATRLVVAAEVEPGRSGLFVVPRLGGALRRVANFGSFDLQRGTDTLLVVPPPTEGTATRIARVVDLESGRTVDSIPLPSTTVYAVAWSPDHQRFVAAASEMLYIVSRNGAVTDSVVATWKANIRWTPKGDAIVGFIPAPGRDDAFIGLAIDGAGRVRGRPFSVMPRVQTLYRGEFDLAWKIGAIAYLGGDVTNELWTFGIDGRSPARRVGNSTTFYDTPVLAPDGRTLFAMRGDALGDNIYRVRLDSAAIREEPLTSSRSSGVALSVTLTPDGQRLYYALKDTSAMRTRFLDLTSGEQSTVALRAPFNPLGTIVALGTSGLVQLADKGHVLRVQAREGDTPREFRTPDSLRVLTVASNRDGTEVGAIVAIGEKLQVGTFTLAPFAYHARAPLDGAPTIMRVSWHVDGDLYTARWVPGRDRPTLFRVPPSGGRAIPVGDVPPRCFVMSIGVAYSAPTGACVVYDSRGDVRTLRVPMLEP